MSEGQPEGSEGLQGGSEALSEGQRACQRGLKACQRGLRACQRGLKSCQRRIKARLRGLRASKWGLRATTSREGEVVVNNNDKNGVSRSMMEEEEGDFPEIPDWQTEAADVRAGPRSVAKGGIQNVWDRRLSPN